MLGRESKPRPLARSSHVTQAWPTSLSFRDWTGDREAVRQSPRVAATVEGTKEYSRFLPHESCSQRKERRSQNKKAETRGSDKVLMAFQLTPTLSGMRYPRIIQIPTPLLSLTLVTASESIYCNLIPMF